MQNIYDLPRPTNGDLKRSHSLESEIKKRIEQNGGRISFAEYMHNALYFPSLGYYNSEKFSLGKHGDFITATEISPLFALCLARQCIQIFNAFEFKNILEIGAGTGRLAYDLLTELCKKGYTQCQYFIYEQSTALQKKQQKFIKKMAPDLYSRITWLKTLPTNFVGIVFANEVLDALPVHCFQIQENDIKERGVTWEDKEFKWQCFPVNNELALHIEQIQQQCMLDAGYESEINLSLVAFIKTIAKSLKQGIILFSDYGYGRQEYYHPERRRGTLTCFYQHRYHQHPFFFPGLQDISAHVDFTFLIEQALENELIFLGFTTQGAFLFACGLLQCAENLKVGASYTERFQLHQAIKCLTLPTEMGDIVKFMALGKQIEKMPLLGFSLQDRSREL